MSFLASLGIGASGTAASSGTAGSLMTSSNLLGTGQSLNQSGSQASEGADKARNLATQSMDASTRMGSALGGITNQINAGQGMAAQANQQNTNPFDPNSTIPGGASNQWVNNMWDGVFKSATKRSKERREEDIVSGGIW